MGEASLFSTFVRHGQTFVRHGLSVITHGEDFCSSRICDVLRDIAEPVSNYSLSS